MSKHHEHARQFELPVTAKGNRRLLEVTSLVEPRTSPATADRDIMDMAEKGWEHYETVDYTAAEITLRFRRFLNA